MVRRLYMLDIPKQSDDSSSYTKRSQLMRKYCGVIDAIRRCSYTDKTFLANVAGLSWPTTSKAVKTFIADNAVAEVDNRYELIPDYGFYLGISIGSEIKIALIDSCFNPLSDKYIDKYDFYTLMDTIKNKINLKKSFQKSILCVETPQSIDELSDLCNDILTIFLDFFSSGKATLLGIGITFPGIIDKDTLNLKFCPNISFLTDANILDLINENNLNNINKMGISLYVGHDMEAVTAFEKEKFYMDRSYSKYKDLGNIACIYWGMGVGLGLIVENRLNTSICEFGHIPAPDIDHIEAIGEKEQCDKQSYCYKVNDVEKIEPQLLAENVEQCYCQSEKCFEWMMRINVFNSNSNDDFIRKTSPDSLLSFATDHPYRYKILVSYVQYLCTLIINIFNPDVIVLCGKILTGIPELRLKKYSFNTSNGIPILAKKCIMLDGCDRADSVAIGAAILSYHKLLKSSDNDVKSMNINIEWPKKTSY